ncbi:MAG TPA: PDZ domain-containing protein [Steroidobacteraceae bacterium]|nr:PDZ domain-containing protein [Steroidobacteraceae bacterium]
MTTKTNRWLERPAGARRGPGPLWLALVLTGAACLAATPTVHAAEATPQERAALEKQLQDAQSRLDDAARDVADLTSKLYGGDPGSVDMLMRRHGAPPPPRGAMLGINIGGEQTRPEGVEVMSVSPSGPAEQAGLRKGDVVTSVDGKPLRKTGERSASRQLVEYLRGVEPGQVVKLDYLREGKKMSASITTVAAEPPMMRVVREHLPMLEGMELPIDLEAFMGGHGRGFRSLELVPITPKLGQYFGTDKGLLVVRAPAAAGSKLEEGDVILTIGGRTPENPRHAFRILGSYQPSEQVKVEILRQRKRQTVEMQVPESGDAPAMRQGPPPPRAPAPPAAPRTGSVS